MFEPSSQSSEPSSSSVTAVNNEMEIVRVRFDDQCILIPDPVIPSRMPRLVKKSYSLPLWKKRTSPIPGPSSPQPDPENGLPTSPEENHLVFTLSVPSFAKARSPTRGDYRHHPLTPCIIDHTHPRRARRPSLPIPYNPDLITIPLRQCCSDCFPIAEEPLREGETWQEKFTRGARRRRSASVDSVSPRAHQYRRKVSEALPGFDGMMNVDEVDKIHGSRHITTNAITSPDPPTLDSLVIDQDEEMTLLPSLSRQRDPSSSEEKNRLPDPLAPPIKEEEEEQMILLPSTLELTTAIPYDEVASSSAGQQEIQNDFGTRTPELSFSPPPVVTSSPSQLVSSPELLRTPPSHPIPSIPHSTHTTYASSPESMPVALSPDLSFSPSKRRRVPSSPELPNSPGSVRKRSHMHLPTPGSFIKASVEMLKGVSSISGPMAV